MQKPTLKQSTTKKFTVKTGETKRLCRWSS